MKAYEKLGYFYLGRTHDLETGETSAVPLLYESKDLVTHAVCVGMTGSGKTGLCISLLEEAAIDGVPAIIIDPKGDLGNLLLTFPELAPGDFAPWIDPDEAGRKGLTEAEFAAQQADLWRNGLADWDQSGERIARLRDAAEVRIYTPGSRAGLPVSILSSFAAPGAALVADPDALGERISSTATSLLALIGVAADPIQSREHILLSTLLEHAWKEGRDMDLAGLIQALQDPPVTRIGVLELESFYPAKERFGLAMKLNGLLAAPGFDTWLEGEALDVDRILYAEDGRPRLAVFSIAHLSDTERMFFVSLLLGQTLTWMRGRPGTTSLRAILYMDEIMGFMPPVAEPPSKRPLLTLLKQARAYGLGVVLATQNPADLDYKGLSNTGTWFLGRLQTERDKKRVMEGLEGVRSSLAREDLEGILSGLGKRVFLLHNVHESEPIVFHTRWAMSYLRGPLTRAQIQTLMDPVRRAPAPAEAAAPVARAVPELAAPVAAERPVLPPEVSEVFLPGVAGDVSYVPGLLGSGRVDFTNRSRSMQHSREVRLLAELAPDESHVDWERADLLPAAAPAPAREPADGASFAAVPREAGDARTFRAWEKELADHLYRTQRYDLWRSRQLDATSEPGESERDFRIRLRDLAREERDRRADELRAKYQTRIERLQGRIERAELALAREKEQAASSKLDTAVSIGETLISFFGGRATTSRAGRAARGFSRAAREARDVDRAEESLEALQDDLDELNSELEAALEELEVTIDPATEELEVVSLRPRRTDVRVQEVALAWIPVGYRPPAP